MSNVLIISPVPIHPGSAGNRARIAAMVENLSTLGHQVWFMHIEQESDDPAAAHRYWGDRLIRVPYERPRSRLRNLGRRVARKIKWELAYCYGIDEWYDPNIDYYVDDFFKSHRVDAVIVEYVFFSRALCRVPHGVSRIIDTHDVFANRHRHYLEQGLEPTWFSCTPRGEAKALERADKVVAIQENEAEHFRHLTDTSIVTIGHSIPLKPMPNSRIVSDQMLIVGSDNIINVQSLNWFIEKVLPDILQERPTAKLLVAGTLGKRANANTSVKILGHVDDLSDAYAEAQLVINPMQFGTGLKIKSVEALAHARALVTTPVGAEGLESGAGTALHVAETAEEFARCVSNLLGDRASTDSLAEAGYGFASASNSEIQSALQTLFPL